jgi:hypothetical protein
VGCAQRVDILAQDWSPLPFTFAEQPPIRGALAAAALPPTPPHAHLTSVLNFVLRKVYAPQEAAPKGNWNKSMKAVAFSIHGY